MSVVQNGFNYILVVVFCITAFICVYKGEIDRGLLYLILAHVTHLGNK